MKKNYQKVEIVFLNLKNTDIITSSADWGVGELPLTQNENFLPPWEK